MSESQPAHNSPDAVIMHARQTGDTIRCVGPDGSTAAFKRLVDVFPTLPYWLCIEADARGHVGPGRIVHSVDVVRADVVGCWPDVDVVDGDPVEVVDDD